MKKLFVLTFAAILGLCILAGCDNESNLEESAKPVVTDIIQTQLGGNAKCLKVSITEKVDDKHYRAVATLDNCMDIECMIEDCGETICVSIPYYK